MKKAINSIKENIFIFGVCIVFCICLISVCFFEVHNKIPEYATHMGYKDEEQFIYNLSNGDLIEQTFSSPHDFDFASVHFSNHEKTIEGNTHIEVIDTKTSDVLVDMTLSNHDISYYEPVRLIIPGGGIKDYQYTIRMSFEGFEDVSLGIFGFSIENSIFDPCSIDDNYSVAVGTYSYTNMYYVMVYVALAIIMIMVFVGFYIFTRNQWAVERKFLLMIVPICVFFLSFLSFNDVHDGTVHYAVTYHYANVFTFNEDPSFPEQMSLLPDENKLIAAKEPNYHIENRLMNERYQFIDDVVNGDYSRNRVLEDNFLITTNSSIVEYLPAIVGVIISRGLFGNAMIGLLIAKMFMLSFYVFVIYWAIKITPMYKNMFALAGLIPMNLYQATGVTYDSIVTPICMLLIALFIKAYISILSNREIYLIWGLCVMLGLMKGGVYLLIPLIFISVPISISSISSRRKYICIGGVIAGFGGLLPCLYKVYGQYFLGAVTQEGKYAKVIVSNDLTNTSYESFTFSTMLHNPINTIRAILGSFINSIEKMFGQALGNRMSWTDLKTNWIIIFAIVVLILLASLKNEDESDVLLTKYSKVLIIVLIGMELVAISLIMLIADLVPIGAEEIKGVQGRYFLPWIPLLLLVFSNNQIKITKRGQNYLYYFEGLVLATYGLSFLLIFMGI